MLFDFVQINDGRFVGLIFGSNNASLESLQGLSKIDVDRVIGMVLKLRFEPSRSNWFQRALVCQELKVISERYACENMKRLYCEWTLKDRPWGRN